MRQVLEQYRHWGERVRGVPRNRRERKQLERPVLWRDAYADRPFTNQQRLRSGTLPVLERNPAVTIDDTGKSAQPKHLGLSIRRFTGASWPSETSCYSCDYAHSVAQAGCGRGPAIGYTYRPHTLACR